jgi:hypothetical protein
MPDSRTTFNRQHGDRMNHYLITLVLLGSIIQRRVAAGKPHLAICEFIRKIGKPQEKFSSLTCKAIA